MSYPFNAVGVVVIPIYDYFHNNIRRGAFFYFLRNFAVKLFYSSSTTTPRCVLYTSPLLHYIWFLVKINIFSPVFVDTHTHTPAHRSIPPGYLLHLTPPVFCATEYVGKWRLAFSRRLLDLKKFVFFSIRLTEVANLLQTYFVFFILC